MRTEKGKLYTDFIIAKPQDLLKNFKPQLEFAHKHFDTVWDILSRMTAAISNLISTPNMNTTEKIILQHYSILKVLQDFQQFGTGKIDFPKFPKRKDGGWWLAQAVAFDAGYNTSEYQEAQNYAIQGGHRTTEALSLGRTKRIRFYEFDTALCDNPHRYGDSPELYFKYIIHLLWHIYDRIPLESSDIPNEFFSYMPTFETSGLIGYTQGIPYVKIPVIEASIYQELCVLIHTATDQLKSAIGNKFATLISSMKLPIPSHLTSVPDLYRYTGKYFAMAIIHEAYYKGLHLKNINYCCPPAVLVYEE